MKLKKSKRERDLSLDGKIKKKTKSKKHSDSASLNKTADPGSLSDDDTELSKLVNQKNAHVIDADLFKRTYFGPDEQTLELDCWEEGLSEVQLAAYKQAEAEHQSVQCKLDEIVKETGGEVVYTGDQFMAYQLIGKAPGLSDLEAKSAQILRSQSREPEPLLKKKGRKEKQSYRDFTPPPPPSPPRTRDKKLTRGKKGKVPEKEKEKEKEKEREKDKKEKKEKSIPATPTNVQSVTSGVRPSEASAIGGLATGAGAKSTPVVDLTKEDTKHVADSREVSFNKLQGKTFPSLVVVARPYLHAKDSTAPTDRAALDSKVKSVLMHTPTKFTEWLIQHGLVKSEQVCAVHPGNKLKLGMYSDVSKFPYSGGYVWISECCPTRFVSVFSGSLFEGATHPPSVLLKLIYHWACQTNVQNVVQWVKVDNLYVKGLFTWLRAACTAALHHHICLLGGPGKKIEVGVISLGTTSHDGTQRQVKVEVLGILDTDAKLIRLRAVEPLSDGERNYKKRFQKILEPLTQWVNPASIIVTDLTVDKGTLVSMGFKTVHQSSSNDPSAKHSNANIMEYLRRIVPRMFQNTLSLLSRQIIQQFLDELVWREWYGTTPGQAFDNVVTHLAEQTRIDGKDTLSIRLNKISANPFKNWRYVNKTKPVEPELPVKETKRSRKRKASPTPPPASPPPRRNKAGKETRRKKPVNYVEDDDEDVVPLQIMPESKRDKKKKEKKEPKKKKDKWDEDIPLKMIKKEMKQEETVVLERYYFGQVKGDVDSKICKRNILVQCLQCSKMFNNNCQFMIHIYQHIAGVPLSTDSRMVAQCIYCLQHFADVEALEAHLHQSHPKDTKSPGIYTFACLICEIRFTTMQALANHMQKTHAPLELPYNCGVCEYRSSSHRACIDHFHSIHGGGESIQCPYCLKVVAIYANGCDLQSNIESFMKHLMLHQDKQLSHKCNRCILRFVHTGMMREHQVRAHHSVKGAKPLCVEEHIIGKPKNKATPPVKDSTHHSILDSFDNVTLVLPQGMLCKECDTQLDERQHFLGTCKCNKCTFVTCCWRAMLQHSSVCMGPNAQQTLNTTLPSTAHCICSFETDDAGALLNHLLLCDRRTAYSSEEDAKSNKINISKGATTAIESPETKKDNILEDTNAELSQTDLPSQQTESMADYPAPPSVINTQLSLDDLAPPSVLQPDQMDLEPLKNEAYEQPLATPQVRHHDLDADPQQEDQTPTQASRHLSQANQSLDSYMDSTGEFEPLPAEPLPQPEFEPL